LLLFFCIDLLIKPTGVRNLQKIKRIPLKIDQTDDFNMLGIVSSEPDYKLSLSINKKFSISLKSNTPVKIIDSNEAEQLFSRFSYVCMAPDLLFSLISNRSGKYFLLKKLKNVDYILLIQDPELKNSVEGIIAGLREIKSVSAVFNVDISSLKDRNLQYLIP